MAFPQSPLDTQIELQVGGVWTDITADVYTADKIVIARGRPDEGQRTDPGKMTLVLNNRSGKYSPRNPLSPYYGLIGRNTPMRVSVLAGSPFLRLPGADGDRVSTPDATALDITGDIDIRIDAALTDWGTGTSTTGTELCGKYDVTSNQRSWLIQINGEQKIVFRWSTDGTAFTDHVSDTLPLPTSGRLALRVTLDVDNGAGGNTVAFYTAETIAGPWTQLGATIVNTGTTSIFNSTAGVDIGDVHTNGVIPAGRVYAFELRNGIDGTVVANPAFTTQTIGATSFTDSAGRTWTLEGGTQITNRRTRFVGEVSSWPARWDVSGKDVRTPVEAAGILRRLGQGERPLQSAMRREFGAPERTGIVAYWPCEDDSSATQIASALPGHPPIPVSGGVSLAAYSDWAASAPLPTLDTGLLRARVPYYDTTPDASLRFFLHVPQEGVAGDRELARITTAGTATTWTLTLASAGHLRLRAFDREGDSLLDTGAIAFAVNGRRLNVDIELVQNGANIDWAIFTFNIDDLRFGQLSSPLILSGTLNSRTISHVTNIRFGDTAGLASTAIGHIALGAKDAYASTLHALIGWSGERAGDRIRRIAREEGVPFAVYGDTTAGQLVGAQRPLTFLDLVEDATDADGGILYERRDVLAVAYRQRHTLYNQEVALALDYTTPGHVAPPLEPVDDDQSVRNDITVQRDGGSSGRAVLEAGPLSVQAPPDGVGLYDESVTINLYDDDQAEPYAYWLLHLGTVDEARYPVLNIDLAAAPSLVDAVTGLDSGDRIQIANPPAWLPPGPIDLLVQGYEETIGHPVDWDLRLNCTPARPWTVGVVGDSQRGRIDANPGGSTLAVASVAGDGQLLVHTPAATDGQLPMPWITSVGRLTGNPDFELDTSGWTVTGGTLTRVPTPGPAPFSGSWSGLITPNGSTATVSAESSDATVTAGSPYRVYGWLRCATTRTVDLCVNWYGTGGTFLSTTVNSIAVTAGAWTRFDFTQTAPASAVVGRARPRMIGTPPSSDLLWFDVCFLGTGQLGSYPAEFPFDIRFGGETARVLANAPAAWDTFARTVSSAWGTADSGLTWQQSGGTASDRAVTGSAGTVTLAATPGTPRFQRIISQITDCEVLVRMSVDQVATGSAMLPSVLLRYTGTSDYYRARLHFGVSGAMATSVTRATTQVGSAPALPYTYTAGQWFWLRARLTGHRVQVRAWPDGQAEPNVWHSDQTITTEGPIASGEVGVTASAFDSNTNVSPQLRYDDFQIVTPQLMTVQRSINGVTKAHDAGTEVRLAQPAVVAL